MISQNYECAGFLIMKKIIGVIGFWYSIRHYACKSVELDHVCILEEYRNEGLQKKNKEWIRDYCQSQACTSMELNIYVDNYPSHKFYYNESMEIWGYHFFKHL